MILNKNNFYLFLIEEFVKRKLPDTPLAPDLQMHWLAVNGVQPQIPENPIVKIHEADEILIPPSISKDAKVLRFSFH